MRIVRNSGECFDGFANGRNLTSFIACDKLLSGEGGGFMVYSIDQIRSLASPIAASYGVRRMSLFGSYARGEVTPESDIDFRVDRGDMKDLLSLGELFCDLEDGFDKKLDVLTTQMLSPAFLQSIRPEEVLIYARD